MMDLPASCIAAFPPADARGPRPSAPAFPLPISGLVRSSDESTSVVVEPDVADQIPASVDDLVAHTDIVYATRANPDGSPLPLRLDLLFPPPTANGADTSPLIVYVSGGGFVVSMKDAALRARSFVAAAGFAVASVQHRTVLHGATFVDAVSDVKEAVRFLRAHASEYAFDPTRVGIWGESAGGYIAAMVGTTGGRPEFLTLAHPEQADHVDAVVDFFGPSDLSELAEDHDADTKAYYESPGNHVAAFLGKPGRPLRAIPDAVTQANPVTYVRGEEPAFLLFHGSRDSLVSPSQTLRLHTALLAAGGDSTRYVVRDADHGDLPFLGDSEGAAVWFTHCIYDTVTAFLRERLATTRSARV